MKFPKKASGANRHNGMHRSLHSRMRSHGGPWEREVHYGVIKNGSCPRGYQIKTNIYESNYSLGITFYELIAHRLPFEADDPMELVHCHLAKRPVSPVELNADIPKPISDIVMKLLLKTAEERYRGLAGSGHGNFLISMKLFFDFCQKTRLCRIF